MSKTEEEMRIIPPGSTRWKIILRNSALILAALFIFLFALDLMISSLEHLGRPAVETIILATSNPFTGLFIGLLVTALIQSSSATTSITIALVASGSMNIESAVPVIMGANVGTTITSAIVSLGFITRKKEFKRAVAAGTYHSFFNILTVVVLFPLEYYYGFLSKISEFLATTFFGEPMGPMNTGFSFLGNGLSPVVNFLVERIDNGFILGALSVALLFSSILFFRKVLKDLLGFGSQERFQKFFFQSPFKSFAWGVLTTAAIRSSTVTTSLVVPLVAKKIVKLRAAAPFIMGANIGTTITAFIAAMFNSNAAISIAIAHFLFNFIGVLIFFPIPYLKEIPVNLARGLGKLTLRYRLLGFLYLLLTFFVIPFSLIYINKSSVSIRELHYVKEDRVRHLTTSYTVTARLQDGQKAGSWKGNDKRFTEEPEGPGHVVSIYRQGKRLFIDSEMYEFSTIGSCTTGQAREGRYTLCLREVIDRLVLKKLVFDTIYVFEKQPVGNTQDPIATRYFVSSRQNLVVRKEKHNKTGEIIATEELDSFEKR